MSSMTLLLCHSSVWSKLLYRRLVVGGAKRKFNFRALSTLSNTGFNDYELERKNFNLEVPDKFNFASDVVDVWAQKEREGTRKASNPAFWYISGEGHEVKWNFQNLEEESKRTANVLQEVCGLKRGDNLLVMLPKVPEFWLANLAAIRAGVVVCPCSMMLTAKDLAHRFTAFQPSCIIAHESVAGIVDEAAASFSCLKAKVLVSETNESTRKGWLDFRNLKQSATADHKCAETSSDENMMVFFTSGTSGLPKMAEHTHASYGLGHSITGKYMLDLNTETMIWNLGDTGWSMIAYASLFGPWSCGSGVFIHKMPRFSPTLILQVLSKYPITSFCAAPLVYRGMLQENMTNYKFCKLSHSISGGEPMNPEIIKRWEAITGLKIYEGYGQTETVMSLGMFKCLKYKPGATGKPPPGIDVVILDENENEVGPGVQGEIALKRREGHTYGLFKGYKNDPEKTKKVLTEKYYHTGDNAYYDEEGYFWFVGRKDDLINSAGYRIGPFEVENALLEHPAVMEVAATSSPDPERGEVVKAFIVLKEAYADKPQAELIKELQEHTKRITAPYKYPRKIEFVKELPKTISGKIKRYELKNREWKRYIDKNRE